MTFDFLDRYEWEFLQPYRASGFVNVKSDLADHYFNQNFLIDFANYEDSFGGGKKTLFNFNPEIWNNMADITTYQNFFNLLKTKLEIDFGTGF